MSLYLTEAHTWDEAIAAAAAVDPVQHGSLPHAIYAGLIDVLQVAAMWSLPPAYAVGGQSSATAHTIDVLIPAFCDRLDVYAILAGDDAVNVGATTVTVAQTAANTSTEYASLATGAASLVVAEADEAHWVTVVLSLGSANVRLHALCLWPRRSAVAL